MSKLQVMLEYQSKDIELRKILDKVDKSDDSVRVQKARLAFDKAKQAAVGSEEQAASVNGFFDKAIGYCGEMKPKVDELVAKLEKETDPKKADEIVAKLQAIRAKIVEIDKRASKERTSGDKSLEAFSEAQEKGKTAKAVHTDAKSKVEALRKGIAGETEGLEKIIAELAAKLDPKFVEAYKKLASEKKYPPLAELAGKSCRGCGMELSMSGLAGVSDSEYGKCDNCGRMVYQKAAEPKKKK